MRAIGIDLGWHRTPSGVAVLEWDGAELQLSLMENVAAERLLVWVRTVVASGPAIVGVDAPLVIRNHTGTREADRLAHKLYGKYHAGCYPANLGLPFAPYTTSVASGLARLGFRHADRMEPRSGGRYQAEVFPHAGCVQLFGLDRILKYKKGPVAARRAGLESLRQLLEGGLPRLDPPVRNLRLPAAPVAGGVALKAYEDRLDAVLCAYLAAYWWYWGLERNEVLGNARQGYIVVPKRHSGVGAGARGSR